MKTPQNFSTFTASVQYSLIFHGSKLLSTQGALKNNGEGLYGAGEWQGGCVYTYWPFPVKHKNVHILWCTFERQQIKRGAQTILPSHLYVVTAKCSGYFYKVNSRTDYAGA